MRQRHVVSRARPELARPTGFLSQAAAAVSQLAAQTYRRSRDWAVALSSDRRITTSRGGALAQGFGARRPMLLPTLSCPGLRLACPRAHGYRHVLPTTDRTRHAMAGGDHGVDAFSITRSLFGNDSAGSSFTCGCVPAPASRPFAPLANGDQLQNRPLFAASSKFTTLALATAAAEFPAIMILSAHLPQPSYRYTIAPRFCRSRSPWGSIWVRPPTSSFHARCGLPSRDRSLRMGACTRRCPWRLNLSEDPLARSRLRRT